jgi:hypothetical protein
MRWWADLKRLFFRLFVLFVVILRESIERLNETDGNLDFSYVQGQWRRSILKAQQMRILIASRIMPAGMNVLSAPFLYTQPTQIEAFACFSTFIEKHCPLYVQRDLRGVHRGLEVSGSLTHCSAKLTHAPTPAATGSVFGSSRSGALRSSSLKEPVG